VLQQVGRRDLAYLGTPELDPEDATVATGDEEPLATSLAGGESCDFTYEWETSGTGGALRDDDGNEGTSFAGARPDVFYVAGADASAEQDDVRVGYKPPDQGETEYEVFAGVCGVVRVSGCGDGVVQSGEQCDGDDDAQCQGSCGPTCMCTGCGDGIRAGTEQCDVGDDAACPGRCQGDCQCQPCTPGDPSTCGATRCCNASTGLCCRPRAIGSDPPCPFAMNSCCGTGQLEPDFCLGPGPGTCPVTSCQSGMVYSCLTCDAKLVERTCTATGCTPE
jgi:hypothetical protein